MQYLPLFLLFMAALIAAYFYLQRAMTRGSADATTPAREDTPSSPPPTDTSS